MKILLTILGIFYIVDAEFNVTINGYFYYISYPLKLDWFQSFRHCRSKNMHLLDLTSHDEINRTAEVVKYFKANNLDDASLNDQLTNFWTSGADHGDESNFYWMSNGNNFVVTNWAPDQPDNLLRLEHCVEMRHTYPFQWNDEYCGYKKNFICRDRIVLPAVQTNIFYERTAPISDSEKPVRVANASYGFTYVSLI